MLIIGLTGSIGMGKSTSARILKRLGFPVYDADKIVHGLLAKEGAAVKSVAKAFPQSLKKGAIDRKVLGQLVFGKPDHLTMLEKILHPLVHKAERLFLKKARQSNATAAILEIPLMYETGAETRCDIVLCVTAPRTIQKQRVMSRPGMTEAKYKAILRRQLTDKQKRSRADHIVYTHKGYADTKLQLEAILNTYDLF